MTKLIKMAIEETRELISDANSSGYSYRYVLNEISSDAQKTLVALRDARQKINASNEKDKEEILKLIDSVIEVQSESLKKIPKHKENYERMSKKLSKASGWLASAVEDIK